MSPASAISAIGDEQAAIGAIVAGRDGAGRDLVRARNRRCGVRRPGNTGGGGRLRGRHIRAARAIGRASPFGGADQHEIEVRVGDQSVADGGGPHRPARRRRRWRAWAGWPRPSVSLYRLTLPLTTGKSSARQASPMPVMAVGELAHDAGFFGVAEIEVVGDGERGGAGGGEVAPGFGDGLGAAGAGIGGAVAGRAIGGERERAGEALEADDGGIGGAGALDGLAADGGVVLVPHPGARAEIGAGDQLDQERRRRCRRDRALSPSSGGGGRGFGGAACRAGACSASGVERDVGLDDAVVASRRCGRCR